VAAHGSTTIRVEMATRDLLSALAAARGTSIQEAARDAAEALRRQEFARAVRDRLAEMRADPDVWAEYLADAETTAVDDGIGR
jgi:hypothetical protein